MNPQFDEAACWLPVPRRPQGWCCCAAAACARSLPPSAPPPWGWRPTTSSKDLKATRTTTPTAAIPAAGAFMVCPGGKTDFAGKGDVPKAPIHLIMRAMSFLAIDVGNTRLKWALYEAPRPAQPCWRRAPSSWTTSTPGRRPLGALPAPTPHAGLCGGGRRQCKRRVEDQMELWDVPAQWVVSSAQEAGLTNGYDHPSRLGCDRWVAMIGARHRVLAQGPGAAHGGGDGGHGRHRGGIDARGAFWAA
jgi:hypothetical protein